MNEKLQGVFTPTLVPLDAQGRINEGELRRFVSWLIDEGVHGLYPNGSTGEFTRFTAEERKLIVRITCEEARGRVPVLAGAAEANVKETLGACELYASYGAHAVAIVSPFYYKLSPESVYAHFREVAHERAHRRDALQHPDVREPDRCADAAAPGGTGPHRRHQGFDRRRRVHDAHDRRGAAQCVRTSSS